MLSLIYKPSPMSPALPHCPEIIRAEAEKRLSPAMLSYLDESRRVDNGKMLRELGITLHHPDLRRGLLQ
ncbi:MAG TPA: hypothetical protein ENJ43_08660 [Gammaproteobacteria bacterium]|nr:hypothetical protein [Gammaproteobacteria bacterium]